MKYEKPEVTASTSAIDGIQSSSIEISKTPLSTTDTQSKESHPAYADWE
jgi:hypothetical protein